MASKRRRRQQLASEELHSLRLWFEWIREAQQVSNDQQAKIAHSAPSSRRNPAQVAEIDLGKDAS
jgi:hypothetical protein